VELGLHLPHVGPLANRDALIDFARFAEERDFDSLWVSDHVIIPRKLRSRYPYSPDGSFPIPPDLPFLEPLATLLFVAGVTQRIKLGTTILVVPMRNPVITAKMLSTLDVLSNGRLILGAGAGWMQEEFELLDVPFEKRGARLDDYLHVIKALWTQDQPSFQGKYYSIDEIGFAPKPVQKPHPPIWIGGHSTPALRRAGRLGDAWHAAFVGPDVVAKQFQEVRQHAEAAGRDPNAVALTVRTRLPLDQPDRAVEQLQRCREIGVSHVVCEAFGANLERLKSLLDVLANQIRPRALA
jgi:probable F420-dependent oxidoreductase